MNRRGFLRGFLGLLGLGGIAKTTQYRYCELLDKMKKMPPGRWAVNPLDTKSPCFQELRVKEKAGR